MEIIPKGHCDKDKFKIGKRVRLKYIIASESPRFIGETAEVIHIDCGPYHYRLAFDNRSLIYNDCKDDPDKYSYHSDQLSFVGGEPDENGNLY